MTSHVLIQRLVFSLYLFVGVLIVGTVGFWAIGNTFHVSSPSADVTYDFTLLNCFYMAAITVTGVGYTEAIDFHAHLTSRGETVATVFAAVFCLVSYLIVVYASANIVAALVQGAVGKLFQRMRTAKMIEKFTGHYIVCGVGTTGAHVIDELERVGEDVVAIDRDPERLTRFENNRRIVGLEGDATDDGVLMAAGLERARGVFAVLHDDRNNLFVALTARQANADARIVARATHATTMSKLRAAGADAVVAPNMIGGLRMASEMVRPGVVSFLDTMLRATDQSTRFNEVPIREKDDAAGRTIGALRTPSILGINVVAILKRDQRIIYNPGAEEVLDPGDALISICTTEQLDELRNYVEDGASRYAKPD